MKAKNRHAVGLLCAVLLADSASDASAQPAPSVQDLLSGASSAGCAPPVSRGGVIQVDCAGLEDGVVYYFDESTRAMIAQCWSGLAEPNRCPPPQWPIEVAGCDGTVPQGIAGTWRYYALPGADGFYPIAAGWTMTFSGGSVLFDFQGIARVVRSYTAVAAGDRRYTLEIKDARSATAAISVELVQCGMIVEGLGVCDAFCRNVASEFGISNLPEQLEPLFPARAYFRTVTPGD
jgi:hypothetical protein